MLLKIMRRSLKKSSSYFVIDKFQQAGYQALAEEIKKTIHLDIARYYEAAEVLEGNYLFVVADHYSKALDCLGSTQEMKKVIETFFKAAHAANLASAYDTARQYLELIMAIAPQELKKKDTFLLRIYTEYHLTLFSLARFEELDQTYIKVVEICKDPLDLVDCCCLQLISLSNRSRYEEGFFLGVSLLEKLGVQYPEDELENVIEAEYEKFCEYEGNGSIERLDEKEMLGDRTGKAIAKLLNRILGAGQFYNPLGSFWATLININLMIEKGITGEALEMSLGLITNIIAYKHDFYCGNILVKKALSIVEREGLIGELYRMYHINGLVRCHWFEPVEQDIYYAHEAYKGNLQNGEFEFSCYSFFTSQAAILECCNTVSEMQDEVEAALSCASKMGNLYGMQSFISYQQIVKVLRGETQSYGSFNDEYFNEDKHVEQVHANAIGLAYYYIYRSLAAVLFGDFATAFTLTEKSIPLIPYIASFYPAALFRFLHSLSICKSIEGMPTTDKQKKLQQSLEENQEWMYQRAIDAPFNFQHLYDLVDAEVKALEGKYDESFRLYEKAILGAKDNKRPYHYALACELAGQRYQKIGVERVASFYLKEAYSAFLAWGATGKTEAMKEKYQHFLFTGMDSAKSVQLSSQTLTNSIDINALRNSIDINAVIKTTQMISGQIEKAKLLEKLMTIIIENSGSNRGYILTTDENSWLLSVYEIANRAVKIIIDNQEILLDSKDIKQVLPLSVINYVIRTKEPVIIGNIQTSQFSTDKYFSENITSSVMCFPILFHNALKGIVYLENDLLTEAFTEERLKVLNIFASQAAISLENASLYSNLEKKVAGRTCQLQQEIMEHKKTEEALRQSEERFSKAFHVIPIMMAMVTVEAGVFIDVNEAFCAGSGYTRQEIIGYTPRDINLFPDLQKRQQMAEELMKHGKLENYEIELCTKTGEIRQGRSWSQLFYFDGKPCHITGRIDTTEQKRLEQEIARLDRLNLVGQMAASIGHEIRNPMTSVRGFLQMFEDKYSEDKEFLSLMIEELDRANAIITEFLSLAKNKMVELIPMKLNVVLNSILPLIQATATIQDKTIRMAMETLPDVLLDKKEIRQIILNLVHNGLESMAAGGIITIKTFTEGDNVVLSIRDQGKGIDREVLDKLGTPFFTTKEKGTGLGLAVCYGIASRHGASIDIETGYTGTTVSVRFPFYHSATV